MNILIDDTVFDAKNIFSQFGNIETIPGRDITHNDVKNYDILIVRSRTKVNKDLLYSSKIKFIGSAVAGLDHIDLDYLTKNNIKFAHAGGCNANAVAEYVISAVLNLAKNNNFNFKNKTLGIVGVGNVGSKLQKKAQDLGINVLLNDIKKGDFVSFDYLLKNSDIISFHTPLDTTTYQLLSGDKFSLLKDNCIVINSARGGIINEREWVKHQGIKIVDCWESEPDINQELLKNSILATPHIAGHSIDAKFMGSYMIYQQLCNFLNIKKQIYNINFNHKIDKKNDFLDFINQVYDFTKDDRVLRNGNFEDYRRLYPARFEWQNYQ